MVRLRPRSAFSLFQLLVVLALLAILFGMLFPAILKARAAASRVSSANNLKQLALACLNYESAYGVYPPGSDANYFSTAAYLLPFIEQNALFQQLDFKKPITDEKNAKVAALQIRTFLSPQDGQQTVKPNLGATNYLFSAGSKPGLADNNGVFYLGSKVKIADVTDGTSNTLLAGETLKGDGGTRAADYRRQHVRRIEKDLAGLTADSGVEDWKDNKNIAGDRCSSWIDGRFLQGTFTATRLPNEAKPDVDCGGVGGLSGLRSYQDTVNVALCDASVRAISVKISKTTWQAAATRNGGEVLGNDF
jgi:type II secretory pathway pseudopilin PulG